MRILAINGSPKGKQSNTWRLTSSFIDGITAQEEDAHGQAPTVDALSVGALDIKPCRGCFSCWSKTPGKCCIHDDMQEIIEKILRADVVIWSFPLYYFGLPGPLKNLIDRQLPMSLPFMSAEAENGGHPSRYDMSGKRTVVISTCGFYTAEGNYVMTWVTNFQPNVDAYREAIVAAMNQYDNDPTDANWEQVKTAFVDGWAVQYAAANG